MIRGALRDLAILAAGTVVAGGLYALAQLAVYGRVMW